MGEAESESKFDNLSSLEVLLINGQSLTRLPSMKGLGNLEQFWIDNNKITQIASGAFLGASRLLMISLQHNRITCVADGAFSDLTRLNVLSDGFAPTNEDGSPWQSSFGIGAWVPSNARFIFTCRTPRPTPPLKPCAEACVVPKGCSSPHGPTWNIVAPLCPLESTFVSALSARRCSIFELSLSRARALSLSRSRARALSRARS